MDLESEPSLVCIKCAVCTAQTPLTLQGVMLVSSLKKSFACIEYLTLTLVIGILYLRATYGKSCLNSREGADNVAVISSRDG